MSRCFPFPPPGYNIKPRWEKKIAKFLRRKEKKRQKRERKKYMKNKEYDKAKRLLAEWLFGVESRQVYKSESSRQYLQKEEQADVERSDKSDLTNEHGKPQNICCSSQNIQTSRKRRRNTSTCSSVYICGESGAKIDYMRMQKTPVSNETINEDITKRRKLFNERKKIYQQYKASILDWTPPPVPIMPNDSEDPRVTFRKEV